MATDFKFSLTASGLWFLPNFSEFLEKCLRFGFKISRVFHVEFLNGFSVVCGLLNIACYMQAQKYKVYICR